MKPIHLCSSFFIRVAIPAKYSSPTKLWALARISGPHHAQQDPTRGCRVPQPQSGALTLSYDGRALTVPFLVTYELNRNYDPANGTENCGSGLIVIAGALLLLIIAGTALPILARDPAALAECGYSSPQSAAWRTQRGISRELMGRSKRPEAIATGLW